MDQEPHHHLTLQNDYVKVFKVEVSPGDSIVLHRHDQDTIAIAIGEQLVTVGIRGKPDVHQKNADAILFSQRRIAPSGLAFGIMDSILGFLFLAAFFKTRLTRSPI